MTKELKNVLVKYQTRIKSEQFENLYDIVKTENPLLTFEYVELLKESGVPETELTFIFDKPTVSKIFSQFNTMRFDVKYVYPDEIRITDKTSRQIATQLIAKIHPKYIDVYFTDHLNIIELGGYHYPTRFSSIEKFLNTLEYDSREKKYNIKREYYSTYRQF